MGDKKFTFIELHLDGETQFGPKNISDALPLSSADTAADEDTEADEDEAAAADEGGRKGTAVGALIGLVALVGVAVAVKKFRNGDDDGLEEFDEPDVIVN